MTAFAPGAVTRTIGTVQLNDGVNCRFDRYEFPGTAFVQAEPLWNQGGQVAVVKTDKTGLVVAVYGVFQDGGGTLWEDFVHNLEAQQNVVFVLGDGTKLTNVWVHDVIGTLVAWLDPGPPPVRIIKWSLKLTSKFTTRVPV